MPLQPIAAFGGCDTAHDAVATPVDADGDGYSGGDDCDDTAPDVHSGASEVCSASRDIDCDGYRGCADPDCAADPVCVEIICDDGLDSDDDGHVDCCDDDCIEDPACVEICGDGTDNDCDGELDGCDPDCAGDPTSIEACDDGLDNDCDGLVDCEDGDCMDHCDVVSLQVLAGDAWAHRVERYSLASGWRAYLNATSFVVQDVSGWAWRGEASEPVDSCHWSVERVEGSTRGFAAWSRFWVGSSSAWYAAPALREGVSSGSCGFAIEPLLPWILTPNGQRIGSPGVVSQRTTGGMYQFFGRQTSWYFPAASARSWPPTWGSSTHRTSEHSSTWAVGAGDVRLESIWCSDTP